MGRPEPLKRDYGARRGPEESETNALRRKWKTLVTEKRYEKDLVTASHVVAGGGVKTRKSPKKEAIRETAKRGQFSLTAGGLRNQKRFRDRPDDSRFRGDNNSAPKNSSSKTTKKKKPG